MSGSPYICERLAATRAGIPDAKAEVDVCLSRLQDTLAAGVETAADAYDLLANWARLLRFRTEIRDELDARDILNRAEDLIRARGPDLANLALRIPHPQAWQQQTHELQEAFEEVAPTARRQQLAEHLLTDLDDAQLVLYAARRCGVNDLELEEQLDDCDAWLTHNADLFLAASVFVQAVGAAIRPDLQDQDYGLAVTAIKFQDLLRAAEEAEDDLQLTHVQPMPARVVSRLVRDCLRERRIHAFQLARLALRSWQTNSALAAASSESSPPSAEFWEWRSPRDDLLARLVLSAGPSADRQEPIALAFFDASRNAATNMVGQPVCLCGITASINERGVAEFPRSSFLLSDQPPQLCVGHQQDEWELLAETR